jgi:hypothetical protein
MPITKQIVAERLSAYLRHEISLDQLVDWAERALMDGELDERDLPILRDIIARLGVADVRTFGLTWEDCETMLRSLGYEARVEVTAV